MSARSPKRRRVVSGAIASAAVIALTMVGGASAAEPPTPATLDHPIDDLAVIEPGDPQALPRLLTLDSVDEPPGTANVSLLDRQTSNGWQPTRVETIRFFDPADAPETPWLVALGPDRFVVLATSHQRTATTIGPIGVRPGAAGSLDIGTAISMPMAVDDAGAIDVDADGRMELVVASAVTLRGGETCQGSIIRVLDGATLAERATWSVPNLRLAGGVLGEWDGRPGGDLLAYANGNCPAGPDSAERLSVMAIRLADNTLIAALSPTEPAASIPLPGVPLAADFDGDGRDEVVVRDGAALVILDPAHGWARTPVASGDVMPVLATSAAADDRGTLAWVDHRGGDDQLVLSVGKVERRPGDELVISADSMDLADVAPSRLRRALQSMRDLALNQAAPQAWRGVIDDDGCPRIMAPLLTTGCGTEPDASMKPGATWFATRPIVAYDAGGSRELLVAATMEWDPVRGEPLAPTPAAVGAPGAWRHGPSVRFALSEVRAADAAYFSVFPVPRPTIERAAVRGQATDFPGFTGSRILVRITGAGPDDPPAIVAPTLDSFLTSEAASGELIAVERVPVPAGAESGRDGSFVHVPLGDVAGPDGGAAQRWTVTIAQINDWGEIAGPVRGTIVSDLTGPSLTVDPPFLSTPWPLTATIHGRSEPGVEIRGGTSGTVKADRRGRFELQTQLAPWPQTLELTAVDQSGNVTVGRFSVVGGIDYRAFPWAAIVALTLLIGAVLSAGRGTRLGSGPPEAGIDNDPKPEIEELPSAGDWPAADDWRRARP